MPHNNDEKDDDVVEDGDGNGEDDRAPEGCEMCAPKHQAPVKTIKDPCLPSQKEIDEHFACGHAPFRNWCSICIKSRAVDAPHSPSKQRPEKPTYEFDFAFPTSEDNPEEKLTLFVMKLKHEQFLFCSTGLHSYSIYLLDYVVITFEI